MDDMNILIVIQCRFGSSRLPGKALYPLAGMPMVVFLIRRLISTLEETNHRLVLATTLKVEDDPVAVWGAQEGIDVVRGENEDVMARYIRCLRIYPTPAIVRVTADNPLTCPELINRSVIKLLENRLDYVQTIGAPLGAGVDVFSKSVFDKLSDICLEPSEREHINKYIIEHRREFKTADLNVQGIINRPDIRLTVDTKEDWNKIKRLFGDNEKKPWEIPLHKAIERFDSVHLQACA